MMHAVRERERERLGCVVTVVGEATCANVCASRGGCLCLLLCPQTSKLPSINTTQRVFVTLVWERKAREVEINSGGISKV